jgi:hypothetical protein
MLKTKTHYIVLCGETKIGGNYSTLGEARKVARALADAYRADPDSAKGDYTQVVKVTTTFERDHKRNRIADTQEGFFDGEVI